LTLVSRILSLFWRNKKMSISNRLSNHFALAAVATAAVAATSNAAVVYSGVINFVCAIDVDGAYINVETAVLSNGPGTGVPGWDVNPYRASTGSGMNFFGATGGGMVSAAAGVGSAINLAAETSIGAVSNYSSSTATVVFGSAAGNWQYGTNNLVGFRFVAASGATHYGWMRFLMGSQPATGNLVTRTVVDYGYESVAGASILAGAGTVPAPGAFALLGLAGLATRRRRA
jgi:MYXO-CTERM domain-containing protein